MDPNSFSFSTKNSHIKYYSYLADRTKGEFTSVSGRLNLEVPSFRPQSNLKDSDFKEEELNNLFKDYLKISEGIFIVMLAPKSKVDFNLEGNKVYIQSSNTTKDLTDPHSKIVNDNKQNTNLNLNEEVLNSREIDSDTFKINEPSLPSSYMPENDSVYESPTKNLKYSIKENTKSPSVISENLFPNSERLPIKNIPAEKSQNGKF